MGKQALRYGVTLIALYLIVNNATGAGTAFSSGARGVVDITKGLQGRN